MPLQCRNPNVSRVFGRASGRDPRQVDPDARILMGLLRPSAGRIRFGGKNVTGASAERRARLGMGYIPQGREVFPHPSVRENLLVGEVAAAGRASPDYARVFEFFPIREERASREPALVSRRRRGRHPVSSSR